MSDLSNVLPDLRKFMLNSKKVVHKISAEFIASPRVVCWKSGRSPAVLVVFLYAVVGQVDGSGNINRISLAICLVQFCLAKQLLVFYNQMQTLLHRGLLGIRVYK